MATVRRFVGLLTGPVLVVFVVSVGYLIFDFTIGSTNRRIAGIRDTKARMGSINRFFYQYRESHERFPEALEELSAAYPQLEIEDAWGHPIRLIRQEGRFFLHSMGPDGKVQAGPVRSDETGSNRKSDDIVFDLGRATEP